ncbi:hypothetical protein DPMN_044880 [Dreissena polymorpha]|uniref:Uncharacterized protein n=1 Tax=Dreissena polymorpha TaxID=45954 RepID=A0A9D4HWU1_DREPO|nr:hypothetical protein DPMN_044880 [Dreissena polymorpha]
MDSHTLLHSKYNNTEKLHAEGIFAALQGGTMKANGQFSIGIGERFVVVAGITPADRISTTIRCLSLR